MFQIINSYALQLTKILSVKNYKSPRAGCKNISSEALIYVGYSKCIVTVPYIFIRALQIY